MTISVELIDEDGSHLNAGTYAITIDNAAPVAVDDPEGSIRYTYTADEDSQSRSQPIRVCLKTITTREAKTS